MEAKAGLNVLLVLGIVKGPCLGIAGKDHIVQELLSEFLKAQVPLYHRVAYKDGVGCLVGGSS
jgi:hypothetical protein